MEKLLKPPRFEQEPSASTACQDWTHWKTTFENFIAVVPDVTEVGKLHLLTAHLAPNVFRFIDSCTTYTAAINALQTLYVKPVNEIFARHLLASRVQQPGESLDQYLETLKILSKDCNFTAVDAETHKNSFIRDAFIRGMSSSLIRQRLLENLSLSLDQAHTQARSLEMAEKQSQAYLQPRIPCASAPTDDAAIQLSATPKSPKKCFFCGSDYHSRSECPAKDSVCKNCDKRGHFQRVCLARKRSNNANSRTSSVTSSLSHTITASSPNCLSKAVTPVKINGTSFSCLIDTGSSLSFINRSLVNLCNIKTKPFSGSVSMAATGLSASIHSCCTVNLEMLGKCYKDVQLLALEGLCADVLIGHDFLKNHSAIEISFGGALPPLQVCSLAHATVPPVSLFASLAPGIKPIATRSRRQSPEDAQFIKADVEKLLAEEIIEKSNSPWRAQVFVVNGRKRRMVIDYSQTINRFTHLDAYPLPRVESIVERVSKHSVFSTIDLRSAYHQIPILDAEKPFTAFEACGKLYQFRRIPFGVTNGVPCFQKTIDAVIEAENLEGTYPYLDDVTVCGRDQREHDRNLKRFMDAVKKYNLTLNEEKCTFSARSIKLLGYLISNGSVKPDPDRLKPLLNLPVPASAHALQRAIGIFAHHSRWISHYSEKIRPLIQSKCFPLSETVVQAFENLKRDISNAVVSAIDDNIPFQVETDASEFAIAATLTQAGQPVAFFSRTLSDSEQKHSSVEKEAYAIIESVRYWRHYLLGRHFRILTDQKSVSFMFDQHHTRKIKNEKIMRWRLELACYSFDIIYRPGKENAAADTLSRVKPAVRDHQPLNVGGSITSLTDLQALHCNLCHPGITRMTHWVRSKNLPYSVDYIRKITAPCPTYAALKPRFFRNTGFFLWTSKDHYLLQPLVRGIY